MAMILKRRIPILRPWHLTTAEILYRIPDYRNVLQRYYWQEYDIAPEFPRLRDFLDFWQRKLEGPLHSVRVMSAALVEPKDFRFSDGEFRIN